MFSWKHSSFVLVGNKSFEENNAFDDVRLEGIFDVIRTEIQFKRISTFD